jgi:hypothetical protein
VRAFAGVVPGTPVGDAVASSLSTPFLRTAAAAAGGAAQLRGREHPSKIGRLTHYNFAWDIFSENAILGGFCHNFFGARG